MNEYEVIEKIVAEYFQSAFDQLHLSNYHSMDGPRPRASTKYKNSIMKVRVSRDHDNTEVELARAQGPEEFRRLPLYYILWQLDKQGVDLSSEQRMALMLVQPDFTSLAKFLVDAQNDLAVYFRDSAYIRTLQAIEWIEKERFGYGL